MDGGSLDYAGAGTASFAEDDNDAVSRETPELVKALREDYPWARGLDDGSIAAVGRLFVTTAAYFGIQG